MEGFKVCFETVASILNYLNPFSDDFILKGFGEWLASIVSYLNPFSDNFFGKKLVSLFSDLLQSLFIPSQERLTAIQNTVTSKFDFIESIKIAINSIKDLLNGAGNAPSITLTLKSTKYTNEMNVKVIDMSWYEPYKAYGDLIITGFVYAFFAWRTYIKINSILNGAAGTVENLENADLHLKNENGRWWIK